MFYKYIHLLAVFLILLNLYSIKAGNETKRFSLNRDLLQITSRIKRQTEDHCLLPSHPAHGEFKILEDNQQSSYSPNSRVIANTIIDLSCEEGHAQKTGGLARAICFRGVWTPAISKIAGCVRTCPGLQTETEDSFIKCVHDNPKVTCARPIEGTRIEVICKPFYEHTYSRTVITCRDGSWNNKIYPCTFKCGQKRASTTPSKSNYPWVVGIYKESNKELLGSATVVSSRVVLSAAHIFTTVGANFRITNEYIVASGKFYRDLDDERDRNAQKSGIKSLYMSDNYKGRSDNYVADTVIITLETPFTLNEYIQPICIDWDKKYGATDFTEGNEGIVVGWGLTQKNGNSAKELQALTIPYKSKLTCQRLLPSYFKKYFTYDKICAGFFDDNRISTCSINSDLSLSNLGYSGSGFFIESLDSRFYLRGILIVASVSYPDCHSNYFAILTEVTDLSDLTDS